VKINEIILSKLYHILGLMVKVTNEKRLPLAIRNPWLEPYYTPWSDMPVFRDMETAFNHFFDGFDQMYEMFPRYMRQFPRDICCDLADKGDRYVLTADLPGIETDDVKVNVSGRQVEITAEHTDTREEKSKDFIKNERSFVKYQRVLTVPEKISESDITASVNNGILTVELPKRSTSPKKEPPTPQTKRQ